VVARLLGIVELFAVATAMVALVVAAAAYVRLRRFAVTATRRLHPARVHAGGSSRVDLAVENRGRRRSPVLAANDPFDGGRRWAHFSLAPLGPAETARAAYRLPTERRGVFDLGPLELELTDPFGLARRTVDTAPATTLTVYPHIHPIAAMPVGHGPDPNGAAGPSSALSPGGVDFYALREYQVGDDLRRVHWPSTARLDDLMIRQDELPWQGRASVLVDLRRAVHTAESLELALSAAASILNAGWRSQALVRLVTTDGTDSGFGSGHAHLDAILERLAAASLHGGGGMAPLLAGVGAGPRAGAVAVVTTTRVPGDDLAALGRLRRHHPAPVLVLFDPSGGDGQAGVGQAGGGQAGGGGATRLPLVGTGVRVGTGAGFAAAWDRAMGGATAAPTGAASRVARRGW
jgi:uncharacterized protein (DUF58 family)